MATELTVRDVAKLAMSDDWLAQRGTLTEAQVVEAIGALQHPVPLKRADLGLKGEEARALENALRVFGGKINPGAKPSEAKVWRMCVVVALSDLPARTAIKAANLAVHRPMQFLNEVEGHIREEAKVLIDRQRSALGRLMGLRAELERARMRQARLEAPPVTWTQEKVDEANAAFARARIKTRYRLVGDQVEMTEATPEDREREINQLDGEHKAP